MLSYCTRLLFAALLTASILPASASFEQNRGQAHRAVQFYIASGNASAQFKATGVEFLARSTDNSVERLTLSFPGAAQLRWVGKDAGSQRLTYVLGSTSSDVRQFERVIAKDVYAGVDLVFYLNQDKLEYDFVVHPGADASRIRIEFSGREVAAGNDFTSSIGPGAWVQKAPFSYQMISSRQQPVASRWEREAGQRFRLVAGTYDRSAELVVDPVIEFSSYFSGEADDEVIVVGEGFVAGHTQSKLIDGVNGQFRRGRDVFVRLRATPLTEYLLDPFWRDQTYVFGGSGDDSLVHASVTGQSNAIAVTIVGNTNSRDLPFAASSAYNGGASDGFVLRYSSGIFNGVRSAGARGAYFGGSGADFVRAATGDSNLYFAGVTDSADLPVNRPVQPELRGATDGFAGMVDVLNTPRIAWLTYIGGTGDDSATAIQVQSPRTIVIAGETSSESMDSVPGTLAGPSDAYVLWLEMSSLFFTGDEGVSVDARRVGGAGRDRITALSLTENGLIAVGETSSPDLTLLNAGQEVFGGETDAFVLSYDAKRALVFSTYFGGSGVESATSVQVAANSGVYIAGATSSTDLKVLAPVQDANKGGKDGYVALIGFDGATRFASYFGGSGDDIIHTLRFNSDQPLTIGGATTSTDLREVQAWPAKERGGLDGFVAQLGLPFLQVPAVVYTARTGTGQITLQAPQSYGRTPIEVRVQDTGVATAIPNTALAGTTVAFRAEADRGHTLVEFVADGVVVGRTEVRIGSLALRIVPGTERVSGFTRDFYLRVERIVVDSESGAVVPVTPGSIISPYRDYRWKSSDESVLRLSQDNLENAQFSVQGIGRAYISVESAIPFLPEGGLGIDVDRGRLQPATCCEPVFANPLVQSSIVLVPVTTSFSESVVVSGSFQVTSENPDLVLVRDSDGKFGPSAQIEILRAAGSLSRFPITIQALASSGTARVRVHSDQLAEDIIVTVQLAKLLVRPGLGETPYSSSFLASQYLRVNPGKRLALMARYSLEGSTAAVGGQVSNLTLSVSSSDEAVAKPTENCLCVFSSEVAYVPVNAGREGDATLRITTDNPHARVVSPALLQVRNVPNPVPVTTTLFLGRKLQRLILAVADLPTVAGGYTATATIADPTVAALAADSTGNSTGQIQFNAGSIPFIRSIAVSGHTTLKIEIPGFPPIERRVEVVPTGFAFVQEQLNLWPAQMAGVGYVLPYALHPETMEPIEAQSFQAAHRVVLTFSTASPFLRLSSCPTFELILNCTVYVTASGEGRGSVEIQAVDGLDRPSVRSRMDVQVLPYLLQPRAALTAVRDAYSAYGVGVVAQLNLTSLPPSVSVEVTSLDPDVFLLADSQTGNPSASIRVDSRSAFFVVGVNDAGVGRLRISSPSAVPVEIPVNVMPLTIRLERAYSSSLLSEVLAPGQVLNYRVRLGVSALRPGVSVPFSLEATAPDVATASVTGSSTFSGADVSRNFTVTGLRAGELTLTPMFGATRGATWLLQVKGQRWSGPDVMVPNGARGSIRLVQDSNSTPPSQPLTFTIRSLDPSRLTLASPGTGAGKQEAITVQNDPRVLPSFEIVVESRASEGSTQLEISAPGIETSWIRVFHTPNGFQFVAAPNASYLSGLTYRIPLSLAPMPRADLIGGGLGMVSSIGYLDDFDFGAIPIEFTLDNPEMISIEAPYPQFSPSPSASRPLTIFLRSAGTANLGFKTYAYPGPRSKLQIVAQNPSIPVFCSPVLYSQSASTCRIESMRSGSVVRVRSANASRVRVSQELRSASSADLTLPIPGSSGMFYLHSLAQSGSTTVTISADGYRDAVLNLPHAESGFYVDPSQPRAYFSGATGSVRVLFGGLTPTGTQGSVPEASYRPGALPVLLMLRSSDPSVVSVPSEPVVFTDLDRIKSIPIRTLKPGSSRIELVTPEGFATLPSNSIVVTSQ